MFCLIVGFLNLTLNPPSLLFDKFSFYLYILIYINSRIAELSINSTSEAKSVMARVVRMPFYHRFVTIEINRRKKEESEAALADGLGPYREVEESGRTF